MIAERSQRLIAAAIIGDFDLESALCVGEIAEVEGLPLDFRELTRIGARINDDFDQLKHVGGYDHNYVLNDQDSGLRLAAEVHDEESGRFMEVLTTEPGVQFYTGNHLNDAFTGRGDVTYASRSGFCLETQHYPDSINHPRFPSPIVRPEKPFSSQTIFKFSVQ